MTAATSGTLSLRGNPHLREDQRVALVGEAPGPNGNPCTPLWPDPATGAGGRLHAMTGLRKAQYLCLFARANLLDHYPGPTFPLSEARPLAAPLAERLAPRPLILLGRGVAGAFRFPSKELMEWHDYVLDGVWIRAAVIPHPSGRNLWYNDPEHRDTVGRWLVAQVKKS